VTSSRLDIDRATTAIWEFWVLGIVIYQNICNYLVSAALDGGTQVLVFIFTFAVFGGSGKAVNFPVWAGNPDTDVHNIDYCKVNPANAG